MDTWPEDPDVTTRESSDFGIEGTKSSTDGRVSSTTGGGGGGGGGGGATIPAYGIPPNGEQNIPKAAETPAGGGGGGGGAPYTTCEASEVVALVVEDDEVEDTACGSEVIAGGCVANEDGSSNVSNLEVRDCFDAVAPRRPLELDRDRDRFSRAI
mmetsp:Transcript_6421/g.7206  ORF Transcript_6421/g.7206 Transcript_6421/m.7206 type:complete len:155 (+) Transcript_6421:1690-2154(+)